MNIELLGIFATVLLVLSMAWCTRSRKGTIIMRIINFISCILFILYGLLLSAWSTMLSNICICIIDIVWVIKAIKYKD